MGMVGATACAFGIAPGDKEALYVSTDGGFIVPYNDVLQDAKLAPNSASQAIRFWDSAERFLMRAIESKQLSARMI